jgi:flavin-binding protein dodecin
VFLHTEENPMTNRTYRVTEIVGTSPDGIDQAIRNGIERAGQTLRHIDWFEVTQVRGQARTAPSSTSRSG